jgi:transitional endoplasmic reticulum ATPase
LPNPLILVVKNLAELNAGLRAATSGYRAIELPIPTAEQRLNFVEWFCAAQPVNFEGLTAQDLANQTAGLTLVHVENILLEADQDGRLTAEASRRMKDDMIRSEYAGLVEIMEPTYGFDAIGGMERIKAWAKTEIIDPVRQSRTADCPKGVILVGPPGTGKTFFVRGLAREIGFNAVSISMDKILGGIVGESEKRMARVLGLVKALAPVLVFMDEIDQSDVAQRGNGSGNPVASNLFSSDAPIYERRKQPRPGGLLRRQQPPRPDRSGHDALRPHRRRDPGLAAQRGRARRHRRRPGQVAGRRDQRSGHTGHRLPQRQLQRR